ncbi:MAG: hypothetical protein HRF50_17915 [Phycisphaerae bacterium]|jgi:hypothetical protein
MKTFTDNAGRTWTIAINVDVLKRVRGLVDVNLLDIIDGKLIERLYRDPVLLCDVVYAVCKPEADAKSVSDEDFGRAMAGDAIEQATKALLEELVLFSPSPRDRANLQRVLETTWQVMDKARDLVEARLATVDAEQIVAQALVTSGTSSGSAPGSPASIPAG